MRSSKISLPSPPSCLEPGSAQWPTGLADLPDPPSLLRVAGVLPPLARAVAIVGTRFADADALDFTYQLAAGIAACGVTVISGGARGIDGAAHQGALSVGGGTVAVLATGLAKAYPKEHAPLFSEIAASGALVCEGPEERPALPGAFLQRNRLIVALASAVVVVQAPLRSGALSTAVWAKRLKRRLFAVPAGPWEARGQGCIQLLRQGADICTSAADVLSLPASEAAQASLPGLLDAREPKDDAGLPESSCRVLEALRTRRQHPDDLCRTLDMSVAEVQEALLILVLAGFLKQASDGTYVRALD